MCIADAPEEHTIPIAYKVDSENRLVIATSSGALTMEKLYRYQLEAWSHKEIRSFNELVYLTNVQGLTPPTADRIRGLSDLAATMEANVSPSKLAIVAKGDFDFGLARMFQVFRELHPKSKKDVAVFRSANEALAFLGVKRL